MNEQRFTAVVEYDEDSGEYFIPLPDDVCNQLGWNPGDDLNWQRVGDSYVITKKKRYTVVDTIETFRVRYVIEEDNPEWACDTVVCEEAKVFSQEYLGNQIVSRRVVDAAEVMRLCDEDNDYSRSWDDQYKMEVFVTEKGYKTK
jgi:antitoxin component of MazEF toxin-antitoxin module